MAVVVVVAFAVVLPRLADYGDVWGDLRELEPSSLLLLAGITVANLMTFAPPWMAALPGLGARRAFVLTQASTASTYVTPGGAAVGIALSFGMLRAWGFGAGAVALAVALTGVWNQLTLLGFPAVALALLTVTGGHAPVLQTVALVGLAFFAAALGLFVLMLRSNAAAHGIGELAARLFAAALRRPTRWSGRTLAEFRLRAIGLVRRRWHVLTVGTLAGQLTVFAVLVACLRVLDVPGGEVSVAEAFAAWSLVRLLGSLPLTPGGIGIVEVGLTTLLVGFGGSRSSVVAAVLAYRFLTIVPTLVLGLFAAATWRLHRPERSGSSQK
ncbi:MAG: YbhN family protein [Gaiellaceae bacterium]